MTLTAFLHGYPPAWSMGGEVATHRTLRAIPGSTVFTTTTSEEYELDGVQVKPASGVLAEDIIRDAESVGSRILYAHSTMSEQTIRAARKMKIRSILAVHAPPRFGGDLRKAWHGASERLYNTEVSCKEWRDRKGWVLHPQVGQPTTLPKGRPDRQGALTLTSSLMNKGATRVLELAKILPTQRFIIVESPAHETHGDCQFWRDADRLPNVEVWPRLHPDEMGKLWAETRTLLVPSRYETYGMSALEAAWHGIPSIHVDTPHVREGIGVAARLLKTTKVDELRQAVLDVEADHDMWSDMALERVESLAARETFELARFRARVAAL